MINSLLGAILTCVIFYVSYKLGELLCKFMSWIIGVLLKED